MARTTRDPQDRLFSLLGDFARRLGALERRARLAAVVQAVRVYPSFSTTVATSTVTYLDFDSEDYDHGGLHDVASNNSELVCQVAGIYSIKGQVSWQAIAGGARWVWLEVNRDGTRIAETLIPSAGSAAQTSINVSADWELDVGDFVELAVHQDSGSSVDVVHSSVSPTFLSMHRVG